MFNSTFCRVTIFVTTLFFVACGSHEDFSELIPNDPALSSENYAVEKGATNTDLVTYTPEKEDASIFALSTNDLYLWKITFPFNSSGQLSGNNDASESKDIAAWLSSNPNNSYFYTNSNNNKFYFVAPHNGATTSTSGNPRSELRERKLKSNGSGTEDIYWDGSSGTHTMRFTCKVVNLPSSDRLTFAQVHDKNSTLDDVVQIGIKPNPNDGNRLYVTLQGSVLTGSGQNAQYEYLFRYTLNTWLTMRLRVQNNNVKVIRKLNGSWTTLFNKSIKDKWSSQDLDEEYFKAGCYLQDNPNSGSGKVVFSNLDVSH